MKRLATVMIAALLLAAGVAWPAQATPEPRTVSKVVTVTENYTAPCGAGTGTLTTTGIAWDQPLEVDGAFFGWSYTNRFVNQDGEAWVGHEVVNIKIPDGVIWEPDIVAESGSLTSMVESTMVPVGKGAAERPSWVLRFSQHFTWVDWELVNGEPVKHYVGGDPWGPACQY